MGASGLRELDLVGLSRIFHLTYCNDNHPIREMNVDVLSSSRSGNVLESGLWPTFST